MLIGRGLGVGSDGVLFGAGRGVRLVRWPSESSGVEVSIGRLFCSMTSLVGGGSLATPTLQMYPFFK